MTRYRFPGLCNEWWSGEYGDEGTVEHECYLKPGHGGDHLCGCGSKPTGEEQR